MLEVSDKFLEAIERQEIQNIKGYILPKKGQLIQFGSDIFGNIADDVSYSRQCTTTENEFGIGQLYAGTAHLTIKTELSQSELRGGVLNLEFRAGESEYLQFGRWTVTNPQRIAENLVSITATDCIGSLDVAIPGGEVGIITLETRLKMVAKLTGIEFAQTSDEILALIGETSLLFGTSFCATCREEVAAIAGFMGGFVYADRYNRIKFRKIGTSPVLTIPAEMRHSIKLDDYTFGIRGVGYRDQYGHTTILPIEGGNVNTAGIPVISGNPYIFDASFSNPAQVDEQYKNFLTYAAKNLAAVPDWTPGEVEYYGNPALEPGDFVEISGGINGEESTLFLITAEHWQFRGSHTLISAGAAENAVNSGVSGSVPTTSQQITAVINQTKKIAAVDFLQCAETVENAPEIVGKCAFSVREQTEVFAGITLNFCCQTDSEIKINLLFDNEIQPAFFIGKAYAGEPVTANFCSHSTTENGIHTALIEISENCEILGFSAYLWGQNINPENSVIISNIKEMQHYKIDTLEYMSIKQLEGEN